MRQRRTEVAENDWIIWLQLERRLKLADRIGILGGVEQQGGEFFAGGGVIGPADRL